MNEPLSKRELLAGVAMLYIGHNFPQLEPSDIAARAVERTDALLAELERTAPKPETPKADADGWIEHRPGPIPCHPQLAVYCKTAKGSIAGPAIAGFYGDRGNFSSNWWNGTNLSCSGDQIIAWKPA